MPAVMFRFWREFWNTWVSDRGGKAENSKALYEILSGNYEVEKRMALTGRVQKTSVGEAIGIAINEFIIGKQDFGHMITANVYVDDELMDTYVADGILVSTRPVRRPIIYRQQVRC